MMHKKRKVEFRYIVFIILILVALIVGSLFYVFHEDRNLTFIEKGIKDIGLSIQNILYSPVRYINNSIKNNKEKNKMYNDYEAMKEKYEKYELLETMYNEKEKELEEMEELLNLTASLSEGTYVNATTITRNIDYWYQDITINKGSSDGIKKGNAVINSKGLVGYVDKTSNYNSTIKLLTSENLNHKISVKIEIGDSYIYGLLTYYDEAKNLFKVEGISENTGIPKDSKVTTTGLGNTFPSGILIGYVNNSTLDHFELAKTVYVTPSVNFDNITYLTVITEVSEI